MLKFILRPITKGNVDSCKTDRPHTDDTVPSVLDVLRSRARRNQGLWPNPILRRFWWLFQNQSETTGSRKVAPRDSSEMEGQGLRWTIIGVSYWFDQLTFAKALGTRLHKYVCGKLVCYAFSYCTNSSLHNFMCSREKIMEGKYYFFNQSGRALRNVRTLCFTFNRSRRLMGLLSSFAASIVNGIRRSSWRERPGQRG